MHAPPPENQATLQRYALSVLGLGLVGVIIYVSARMNFAFGYSLGRTPEDAELYGMASVAADGFKCLAPFFFFAAIRSRMWSQAIAAAIVWAVVTVYALAGAFGHAALNRTDSAGTREVASTTYKDLRADHKRISDQLAWIPQHRPAATVEAEISAKKTDLMFRRTGGCNPTAIGSSAARSYCDALHKLDAERASAVEGAKLQSQLAEISAKLAPFSHGAPAAADPQATFFAKLTGFDQMTVTTGLLLLIVALLEVCSGLAPYAVMSYFPDRPTKRRKVEEKAPAAANDDAPAVANVVAFPPPKQAETAALEAAPVAGKAVLETLSASRWPAFPHSLPAPKALAEHDLHSLMAITGSVPMQKLLAQRWGVGEPTVSKWLAQWDWVQKVRDGRTVSVQEASHRIAA